MSAHGLILASASPRRRELLAEMGVRFDVVTADVTEHDGESAPHLAPAELAVENARRKAAAVARLHPDRWVLGADTVVALEGRLFGKPVSIGEAHEFLRALGGRTHEVVTGCVLLDPDRREDFFYETTRVTFRPLTDDVIARYLAAVHVLDKAGAYALQEQGGLIVERVDGSRSNVIGLPVEVLRRVLATHGLL